MKRFYAFVVTRSQASEPTICKHKADDVLEASVDYSLVQGEAIAAQQIETSKSRIGGE
jgi:hypothetical protein